MTPRAVRCPMDVGQIVEAMWWHPVYDDDPEHTYLRDLVVRATELAVGGAAAASGIDVGDEPLGRDITPPGGRAASR